MNRCTIPRQIDDQRYVYGECTWHGRIWTSGQKPVDVDVSSHGEDPRFEKDLVPVCPVCGGDLWEVASEEEFWAMVHNQERELPGYEAMLRWSRGKCYSDFETLQSAWHQAMEGQN
jgi:hypothetical protein